MKHFYGWARALDTRIATTGVTSGPAVGAHPGTYVSVLNTGTLVLAAIYAGDSPLEPKDNPFPVDASGGFQFYAPQSAFDLVFSTTRVGHQVIPELLMPSCTHAALPAANALLAGRLARVSDREGHVYIDQGSAWKPLSSSTGTLLNLWLTTSILAAPRS
jgi:hypothetical protein